MKKKPQWTQDQAISYECAREAISELMSIYTARIVDELSRPGADAQLLANLRAERSRLAAERIALRVDQHGEVERIRREYGDAIRAYHNDGQAAAA